MEMTDIEGQENQVHGTSEKKHATDYHATDRRCSVQKGFGTTKQHQHEHHSSVSNVDGFEDFEEFVLDFDDYDLLESIHTQLGSPLEPIRKLCVVVFLWRFTSTLEKHYILVHSMKSFISCTFDICGESSVKPQRF